MNVQDIYKEIPSLETERILLRKITMDDLEDMFEYGSDEDVAKYVTWDKHKTTNDTKEFIEFVLGRYEKGEVAPWGIELKENGKFIGTVDFVSWSPYHNNAEIGYVLSKPYWGKGITTEAVHELIRFGFGKMDLVRIQARCFMENIGSERVMEKIGMTYEGVIRKGMFAKGEHRDLKLYSLLKEEFDRFDL
ncbi:GNAT family N-acetyltransferase [Fictibacillus sp. BK138]|uniref:GNAT family N-acetyltransferase n=1 Tax=Fictibacillus sp. BK138 TaxID=2512121 RepID=UPI001028A2FC|nr:GNAT family protein [Fictibacillus sp. BK138]RZT23788.1 ribosomal-protein-alanine N-acetyltransferase [Fictibacillus sp. BK138]